MRPLNFLRTGWRSHSEGLITARSQGGYWWLGIYGTTTRSYYLSTFITGGAKPANIDPRGNGFAIRCLVREG